MEPVPEPIRYYGQKERSERVKGVIQELDQKYDIDVVVLNEVIAPVAQTIVLPAMQQIGYIYKTSKLTDVFSVTGGILIFSKYPITMEDQTLFGDKCTGIDCFAAKGAAFARIKKQDAYFNVLGVHMQAWPSLKSQVVRDAQMEQLSQFINSLAVPSNEPIIMAGDLNTDLYLSNDTLRHLMYVLKMDMPEIHPESHPFTVDPKENKLVGADDPSEYFNDQWPDGCVDEYHATLICPCCPEEWIDYTMYSKNHLLPIVSSMRAINVKVPSFRMKITANQEFDSQDVSDHFPVIGHFVFDISTHDKSNSSSKNSGQDIIDKDTTSISDNSSHIAFVSILIVLIVAVLIILCIWLTYWTKKKMNKTVTGSEKTLLKDS